jgi:hypothetical protein
VPDGCDGAPAGPLDDQSSYFFLFPAREPHEVQKIVKPPRRLNSWWYRNRSKGVLPRIGALSGVIGSSANAARLVGTLPTKQSVFETKSAYLLHERLEIKVVTPGYNLAIWRHLEDTHNRQCSPFAI